MIFIPGFFFPQKSIKLVIDVYDYDSSDDDDLIDILTFAFSSSTPVSSQYSQALQSSDYEVGILNISYRITCFAGYCGTDCEILCSDLRNNCKYIIMLINKLILILL